MKIMESAQNYLETILMIKKKKGSVRSIDIANELNFSKPSVSVAMKQLRENEFIRVDDTGNIELLEAGMEIATKMYERHVVISKLLERLGVESQLAAEDACKIEHIISEQTFWRSNNGLWTTNKPEYKRAELKQTPYNYSQKACFT